MKLHFEPNLDYQGRQSTCSLVFLLPPPRLRASA